MKKQFELWIIGAITFLSIISFGLKTATSDKVVIVEKNIVYLLKFDYSFTTTTGSDGVKISYPYGWNTSTGSDGRKIVYPYGWNTSTGSDGRKIAYPYGWNTSTGSDGRKIAYPYGWPINNSGKRKYAKIQKTKSGGIAIVFQSVENSERIKKLIEDDEMEDAYEYALYILINENY